MTEHKEKKRQAVAKATERVKEKLEATKKELEANTSEQLQEKVKKLDGEYEDTLESQRKGLNVARKEKRDAVKEKETLQRKVGRLEKKLKEVEEESTDEEQMDCSDMEDEQTPDPVVRLPSELLPRRDEATGRWQAESPEIHAVRLAQVLRGVAPSTVAMNIADVIELVAPNSDVPGTTERQSRLLCNEGTVCSQAMAAYKFAISTRVLSFGWDESTKFGDGVLSCNAQVQVRRRQDRGYLPARPLYPPRGRQPAHQRRCSSTSTSASLLTLS